MFLKKVIFFFEGHKIVLVVLMKINKLCQKLGLPRVLNNHYIYYMTDDSKSCIDNSVFFAIKGSRVDGHDLIDEAINNGATTIFSEKKVNERLGINYIYCTNTKRYLALALKYFHKKTINNIKIIGVIGTNGKTTTTTLIYNYLKYINKRSMLIGTSGCFTADFFKEHNNTTPRAVELYNYFEYAKNHKIKYVIMEISSIAISELRVLGIDFEAIVFTNFSEDHLDYHKTLDRYLFSKLIPFYKLNEKKSIILNVDDKNSEYIIKHSLAKVLGYSLINDSKYKGNNLLCSEYGIEMDINNNHIKSNLIGGFNAYNILPLFGLCDALGIRNDKITEFLSLFKQVDGRMNIIDFDNKHIVIDYAHTEDAVRNVITEIKKIAKGKIYVVVGCGGNREKEKRSKIGSLLAKEGCINIITSDNPRFENPEEIINDILVGFDERPIVIKDRAEAIKYALSRLNENDYLLILGKGIENYIEINGKKEQYSDLNVINDWKSDFLE